MCGLPVLVQIILWEVKQLPIAFTNYDHIWCIMELETMHLSNNFAFRIRETNSGNLKLNSSIIISTNREIFYIRWQNCQICLDISDICPCTKFCVVCSHWHTQATICFYTISELDIFVIMVTMHKTRLSNKTNNIYSADALHLRCFFHHLYVAKCQNFSSWGTV